VVYAEYFINTDPGYGNATELAFGPAPNVEDINFVVDIEGLGRGFHNLFVRVKDENGRWSLTNNKPFCKERVFIQSPDIIKAEYFVNTDPGFGSATNIPIIPGPDITGISFAVDVSSLGNGFHNLYTRVKDANGKWSMINVKPFLKETVFIQSPDIVKAEYFVNDDPGFGSATNIPITPGQDITDISFVVDLSSLGNGFHHLYARVKDANGRWSITNVKPFFKETVPIHSPDIEQAEYFVNEDPGFGSATDIPITPGQDITDVSFTVDLSSLGNGFHHLYTRVKDANGRWSMTNVKPFFKETVPIHSPDIIKAEYFVNEDPGFGIATDIPITPGQDITDVSFTVDLSWLDRGTHYLYVRVKDANGNWSQTNSKSFYKETVLIQLPNIIKAEYFVNTDPGFGDATDIPITPGQDITDISFTVDLSSLGNGFHYLYTRVKDANGKWSMTNVNYFFKETIPIQSPDIVKAEYFVNTDPGFGSATNIPITPGQDITDISFTVDISSLDNGFHSLFTRVMDANGKWGMTNVKSFYKDQVSTELPDIVKVEYFFDTDPGFGNGVDYPIIPNPDTGTLEIIADASGLSLGTHYLYVRVQDRNGKWSITNIKAFDMHCDDLVVDFTSGEGCSGHPHLISDNSTGVYPLAEYHWDFGDGTPIVVADRGDIEHIFATAGVYDVTLEVRNSAECIDFVTKPVTINASPGIPDTPTGSTNLCVGTPTTSYSTTGADNSTSYEWELSPDEAGTIGGSGTIGTVEWADGFTGTAQVRVRGINPQCEGDYSQWLDITVSSASVGGIVTSNNSQICEGSSTGTLTLTNFNGSIIRWEKQFNSEGWTSITHTSYTYSEIVNTPGIWHYRAVVRNGACDEDYSSAVSITVHPLPVVYFVMGGGSYCAGGDGVEVKLSNSQSGFNYRLYRNGVVLVSTVVGTGEEISFGLQQAEGIYTIWSETPGSGCTAQMHGSVTVNIDPLPGAAGPISGRTGVCQGESGVVYTVQPISYANSYVWTLPDGATGQSSTNSITVNFDNEFVSGNISVYGVNYCGEGASATLAITAYDLPDAAGTISGSTVVCQGEASVVYSVDPIANATSYVWGLPNGATGQSSSNSISVNFGNDAVSGDISVYGTNDCGNGIPATLAITVSPIPNAAGAISGITSICQGETSVVYSVQPIAYANSYEWTLPNGATGQSSTNSITVDFGVDAVSGNISVYGVNNCGAGTPATLAITVNTLPGVAGSIMGSTSICQGETSVAYSVEPIAHATSYVWGLPNGATGQSSSNSISVSFSNNAVSGDISVYGTNYCGDGASATLAITVNPLPDAAGAISGITYVCQGETSVVYSVEPIVHATSYTWTLPNGATGQSSTNSITVDFGVDAVSGNISVYGVNDCGGGTPATLAITVNPIPGAAGTISGITSVCQGETQVYSVEPIAHASSYVWTLPDGATGQSTTNSITVSFGNDAVSGDISVYGVNDCGHGVHSALAITVNMKPPKPTITLIDKTLYSDAPVGNQWYDLEGAIAGATDPQYTVTYSSTYFVIVTINGCSSDPSNSIEVDLTGIGDIDFSKIIKVYPNPVSDELIVEFQDNKTELTFEIINSAGVVVYRGTLVDRVYINTRSFNAGIYFIRIETEDSVELRKFIKQ
jgi:hypothetical protein